MQFYCPGQSNKSLVPGAFFELHQFIRVGQVLKVIVSLDMANDLSTWMLLDV